MSVEPRSDGVMNRHIGSVSIVFVESRSDVDWVRHIGSVSDVFAEPLSDVTVGLAESICLAVGMLVCWYAGGLAVVLGRGTVVKAGCVEGAPSLSESEE